MNQLNTLYPIGVTRHTVFCIFATLFFLAQFFRTKRWHQMILAIAIPCSLLVYIAPDNRTLYYGIGILEAVLLAAAFVCSIVQGRMDAKAEKAAKAAAEAAAQSGGSAGV